MRIFKIREIFSTPCFNFQENISYVIIIRSLIGSVLGWFRCNGGLFSIWYGVNYVGREYFGVIWWIFRVIWWIFRVWVLLKWVFWWGFIFLRLFVCWIILPGWFLLLIDVKFPLSSILNSDLLTWNLWFYSSTLNFISSLPLRPFNTNYIFFLILLSGMTICPHIV